MDYKQWKDLAASDEALKALADMSRADLKEMISEDFARMKDYDQKNPHHCLTLLEHSIETAVNIKNTRLEESDFTELRIAAVFHDVGKPAAAKQDGAIMRYPSHSKVSAKLARAYFAASGFPEETVDRICFYISQHDMFIKSDFRRESDSKDNMERLSGIIKERIEQYQVSGGSFVPETKDFRTLLKLCVADTRAQSETVYKNGKRIASRAEKLKKLKLIDEMLVTMVNGRPSVKRELRNKSFIIIPAKTDHSLSEIADFLDKSGCWAAVTNKDKSHENDVNKRYFLRHVGAFIHSSAEEDCICIQRKLSNSGNEFCVNGNVFSLKNMVFTTADRISHRGIGSFVLDSVYLFCFDTGVCLLVLEIHHKNMGIDNICDSLFMLKELNSREIFCGSMEEADGAGPNLISVKDIAEQLLNNALGNASGYSFIDNWSVPKYQRNFILTYAESDKEITDRQIFLLSHNYSSSYHYVGDTDDKPRVYKNNDVCTWGMTTESAACLTHLTDDNQAFIRSTFINNLSSGYLLMFVLLLHQKTVLQEFLAHNELRSIMSDDRSEIIRSYRDMFYRFEQRYNFSYISDVPQYQNLYEIMYDSFKIDQLFIDVKEPLEAIKAELDDKERHQEEEQDKKTERALAILSLFSVFSALADAWSTVSDMVEAALSWKNLLGHLLHFIFAIVIIVAFIILGLPLIKQSFGELFKRSVKKKKN